MRCAVTVLWRGLSAVIHVNTKLPVKIQHLLYLKYLWIFFFLLTVIFVLILGPFPIYDRVQETFRWPDIYRIDRKWPGNETIWMMPASSAEARI